MTQIMLDATVAKKLHELQRVAELCDPSGQVLGRFVPLIDLSEWEPVTPEISEEELDRRLNSNEKRYTTEEVLKHLENL
jgi:hypothetical protein